MISVQVPFGIRLFWFLRNQRSASHYVVYGRLTTIDDSLSLNSNQCHHQLITQLTCYYCMRCSTLKSSIERNIKQIGFQLFGAFNEKISNIIYFIFLTVFFLSQCSSKWSENERAKKFVWRIIYCTRLLRGTAWM